MDIHDRLLELDGKLVPRNNVAMAYRDPEAENGLIVYLKHGDVVKVYVADMTLEGFMSKYNGDPF